MVLHVKVKPNAKKDEINVDEEGVISVKIKAVPVDGKANAYLTKFLSKFFGVSNGKVALTKGLNNAYKTIAIDLEESLVKEKLSGIK